MDCSILTQEALERQIQEWGFMPFFKNSIAGFSIEEIMPSDLLFGDHGAPDEVGAWQWKGPIISHWEAAYGKFFAGKAGFVSLEWLPDLMNWRRGQCPEQSLDENSRHILSVLRQNESMLSRQLKKASGFTLSRKKTVGSSGGFDEDKVAATAARNGTAFDALIARLQMSTLVCIADFEYTRTRQGVPYGWGVARYCTPEAMYEIDYRKAVDGRTPEESRGRILQHLRELFPEASEKQWARLI